nr:hypothetical protein [Rhizobium sp. RCAM05973]
MVAGGSDGAAWKAQLLAAARAEVHVFCPAAELSEAFREQLDQFVHHDTETIACDNNELWNKI